MDRKYFTIRSHEKANAEGEEHSYDAIFEGKTQMEVAEEISISQAQVSRLEKNALKYMRKYV